MIKLRFYNRLGEVVFDKNAWHLTEAEGLSIPAKMLTAVRYKNQPGQTTTSCVANPRTITLSGDINLFKCGADALSVGSGILDEEGILEVITDRFTRQIKARCIDLVFGERNGPFRSFVVQFLCDCPYFEDGSYIERKIYIRKKMLSRYTVLPAVFSYGNVSGVLNYPGSAFSEPIINIKILKGSGTLSIRNNSTGEKIEVMYDEGLFSGLTIDVENRTITDYSGVTRLDVLTDDSFFDGFNLRNGENELEVINSNTEAEIEVDIFYKVRYAEAVV